MSMSNRPLAATRVCLIEDAGAANLEPLTLTRPAFDLLLGARTLADKALRAFRLTDVVPGFVVRPHLAALQRYERAGAAVNDRSWQGEGPALAVHGRWVAPAASLMPDEARIGGDAWIGMCEGRPACAWVGPELLGRLEPNGAETWWDELAATLPTREIGGGWVDYPWDLVARNAAEIERDFEAPATPPELLSHTALVGPAERLAIAPGARLDPYTVLDTLNGPITIEAGVIVQPFTRVEGPCHIGRDTQLFRANLRGGVTLGPNCRIGGEVEQSVVLGYSNKYHEGFLGHAYVGSWVNLGAITSNSDLRNDYGEVAVPLSGDPIPTGQLKVGCFIGDHTRTGLGTMMNTGTAVGVMCNLLPAGPLLPKHVPSFAAVLYGRVAPGFPLDQLFATARTVKGRRGLTFSEVEEQFFRDLYERTRLERERAFQRATERRGEVRTATVRHR